MTQREPNREAYRELVHNPAELATETVRWAEQVRDTPGVPFGVGPVDKVMNPMHPGELGVICGRPGHGKTSLLITLARAEARRIAERGTQKTEAVFYVSWEQVAEEINLILDVNDSYTATDVMRGKVDLDLVRTQAIRRVNMPVWIIGDSISRTNTKSLRMFPDVVFQAIETAVEEYGVKPTLMLFDYIQIIPARNANEKLMQVTVSIELVKELAKRVGCPVWAGAQARREADDREFKIPTTRDVQWASAIEQVTDKFVGLWRPWLTDQGKPPLQVGQQQYPITEELLILQLSKQRFGEAGMTWALHFSPAHLRLCELETRRIGREEVYL